VTKDLDPAIEFMAERFGLEHCLKLPAGDATFLVGEEPAEWHARFAMGARGGMLEVCQLQPEDIEFCSALVSESA
jgi:hypothetical protein